MYSKAVFPHLDFFEQTPTYLFINEQIPPILRLSSSWSRSLILNCIEALCKGHSRLETATRSARYNEHGMSIWESLTDQRVRSLCLKPMPRYTIC